MDPIAFRELVSGRRRGLVATLSRTSLRLLSIPYGWGVAWRNRKFDQGRRVQCASIPVVSVGNLTAGGTGKTPLVEWICRWFRKRSRRVAILSRGYAAEQDSINDEARQLEDLLPDVPHLQDPDRVRMAEIAYEELESQVLVLDDGFQHRRLARDLDIVLIDATNPFGFDYLLPRGLLREPIRNLDRADLVVLTRIDQVTVDELVTLKEKVQQQAPHLQVVETTHRATHLRSANGEITSLDVLRQSPAVPVLALCGIGNPESFRRTLDDLGCDVIEMKVFPDHHRFTREDVDELHRWVTASGNASFVLCTHKDLVKLSVEKLGGRPLAAVGIELQIVSGEEALDVLLEDIDQQIPAEPADDWES